MIHFRNERIESIIRPILVEGLRNVRRWFEREDPRFLRCIFQDVGFFPKDRRTDVFYVPPRTLSLEINHPVKNAPSYVEALNKIKAETRTLIEKQYCGLRDTYLMGLSTGNLLFLLEKLGGSIPCNDNEGVSIYDDQKVEAIRCILSANRADGRHGDGALLINVDISGIQSFIYNIGSPRVLKNLRSRSFFIELLSHHVVARLLEILQLHPLNLIVNAGGNALILSSRPDNYRELLEDINYSLNSWLMKTLDFRLNVVIAAIETTNNEIFGDISALISRISELAFQQKTRKADSLISRGEFRFRESSQPTSRSCEVCRKDIDDRPERAPTVPGSAARCDFCETLIRIGNLIPKARYIFISAKPGPKTVRIENTNYFISETKEAMPCAWTIFDDRHDLMADLEFAENLMFAGNYTVPIKSLPAKIRESIDRERDRLRERLRDKAADAEDLAAARDELDALSDENGMATLEHLAACTTGARLIAALRMDADNMGKLLHKGFQSGVTIERVSSFSRNVNYFFKLCLDSICRNGGRGVDRGMKWVHVIYAGGDDLFMLGAWNHIAELSAEIANAFREFTAYNIDLGLSAGFTVHKPKFPVAKMARMSLTALNYSKACHEPCWFCREDWVHCPLFRKDGSCLRKGALTPFFAESMAALKHRIDSNTSMKYSKHMSRLKLSFKRVRFNGSFDQKRDELDDLVRRPLELFKDETISQPAQGFFQNVLELLEVWYNDGWLYLPKVVWLLEKQRKELEREKRRAGAPSIYDRYRAALHLVSPEMLSALHVALTWSILLKREGKKENDT